MVFVYEELYFYLNRIIVDDGCDGLVDHVPEHVPVVPECDKEAEGTIMYRCKFTIFFQDFECDQHTINYCDRYP